MCGRQPTLDVALQRMPAPRDQKFTLKPCGVDVTPGEKLEYFIVITSFLCSDGNIFAFLASSVKDECLQTFVRKRFPELNPSGVEVAIKPFTRPAIVC